MSKLRAGGKPWRMVTLTIVALLLVVLSVLSAQTTQIKYDDSGHPQITLKGLVPTSPTALTTTEYRVFGISLVNDTGSTVTCAVLDRSTDCGGGACPLIPSASGNALSLTTGQMFIQGLGGFPATNGITWSCSGAGVTGRVMVAK